jgi:hypothetical protein
MKRIIVFTFLLFATFNINFSFAQTGLQKYLNEKEEEKLQGTFHIKGPSVHLAGGVRMQKSPDIDRVDYGLAAIKFSLLNIYFSGPMYLSLAAPGIGYVGYDKRILFSISPIIINHNSGLGLGFDFFAQRHDRAGGPLGFSLNLDVIQFANFVSGFVR